MSTFDALIADLTRDALRAQPKDALQFCANWFQSRLEEQRARTRDLLSQRSNHALTDLPPELYLDNPLAAGRRSTSPYPSSGPAHRPSVRDNIAHSPFGTLNVPGNALLHGDHTPPVFRLGNQDLPSTSPLSTTLGPFSRFDTVTPTNLGPDDFLYPPNSAIFQRRTSVSAESIDVDAQPDVPPPVYPKTPDQVKRIKACINKLFIFRDLEEDQERAVINAMQERRVKKGDIVIRQGDVGDNFYAVEAGLLHCYIRNEPLPPTWSMQSPEMTARQVQPKFVAPGFHPEFGKQVAEYKAGSCFGELALLYGHPRAASILATEDSHLWSLDRVTFRGLVLRLAHKRRMMYEKFLAGVDLLSSLDAQQRSKIADALVSTTYEDGDVVVREGDPGDTFFFIEEGEAIATQRAMANGEVQDVEVGRHKKGDYFGELSLLYEAPRAATVSAVHRSDPLKPKLKVAALDAAAFRRLLGPLRNLMERKAEQYGTWRSR